MLVQIDVYTKDWTPATKEPSQTLYACLATAQKGRLLTVGRKMGDVRLSTDKSVSREHVVLKMVSTNKDYSDPSLSEATTPEEIQACQDDCQDYGLAVVLQNVGKLGTYIVQEPTSADNDDDVATTGSKDKDDDDDDDETDDEEQISQKQQSQQQQQQQQADLPVPLSQATIQLLDGKRALGMKTLGKTNETLCLDTLANSTGRVILQCGKLGSTLVLQRKNLHMVRSGLPKALRTHADQWQAKHFFRLGWSPDTSHFDRHTTTLVVTATRNSSFKQVAAWCRHLPIVTHNYVEAHATSRTSPADPLFPLPASEYAPDGDQHSFWNTARADPTLWSSCTLLSTVADDMECLAACAGSQIVKLYDEQDSSSSHSAKMLQRAKRVLETTPHCFGIQSSATKKIMPELQALGLPFVAGSTLVRCIIDQRLPQALDKKVIGRMIPGSQKSSSQSQQKDKKPAATVAARASRTQQSTSSNVTVGAVASKRREDESEKGSVPSSIPLAREEDESPPTVPMEEEDSTPSTSQPLYRKRRTSAEEEPARKKRRTPIDEESQKGSQHQRTNASSGPSSRKPSAPTAEEPKEPNSSTAAPKPPKRTTNRKQAPPRKGWHQAAGANRKSLKKSREEIAAATGRDDVAELNPVAETEYCPKLLVRDSTNTHVVAPRRKAITGPNFSKFRKNPVPPTKQDTWKLHAVLPHETAEQRTMESQQEELDEQQRRADALFQDPGPAATKRRGRRRR